MYTFLLNLWEMNRLTDIQLQNAVTKGYISQTQADTIKATPKSA